MKAACTACGEEFVADTSDRKFCSRKCKHAAQSVGRRKMFIPSAAARSAHSKVALALKTGVMTRASHCEECGKVGFTEAAHFDYSRPLVVRWLCRSCHVRWDKAEPKGGGHSVPMAGVAA